MRNHSQETGENQKLLISFHGIPQEYTDKGDPYTNTLCRQLTRWRLCLNWHHLIGVLDFNLGSDQKSGYNPTRMNS